MKDTVPHHRQSSRLIGLERQTHPELQVRQVLTKQKGNAVTENEKEVLITRRSARISEQLQSREVNLQRHQNAYNSITETKKEAHPKRRRDVYHKKKTRGGDCSTNSPEIFTGATEIDEENKKKIALDAIENIQDELEVIIGEEYRECVNVKRRFEKSACEEHQLVIEKKCNTDTRRLYLERDEILKAIPNFWLFAFLSHHCLGDLFGEEDQKIFRFVNSMDVKDEEDVISGYTITLKLNDNPYFTNRCLTKRITFCEDGTMNLSAVKIDWKDGMAEAITTDYSHDMPDLDTGFFTWFCAPQVIRERYHDEVSELIKDELWPNALAYFVNGNENGEEDEKPTRRRGVTQKGS
ncbi:hypothetical protein MKX03_015816 [Papaver bracteatum]|nr:hypothetical protein MKX03_015816 [Papaver bracteatum]